MVRSRHGVHAILFGLSGNLGLSQPCEELKMASELKKMTLHAVCKRENGYEVVPYTSGDDLPKGFLKVFVEKTDAEACIAKAVETNTQIVSSFDVV